MCAEKALFLLDMGSMDTDMSPTKWRFLRDVGSMDTEMSVTNCGFATHARNKMALFFILDIGAMDTEMSITKWRFCFSTWARCTQKCSQRSGALCKTGPVAKWRCSLDGHRNLRNQKGFLV